MNINVSGEKIFLDYKKLQKYKKYLSTIILTECFQNVNR